MGFWKLKGLVQWKPDHLSKPITFERCKPVSLGESSKSSGTVRLRQTPAHCSMNHTTRLDSMILKTHDFDEYRCNFYDYVIFKTIRFLIDYASTSLRARLVSIRKLILKTIRDSIELSQN